MADAAAEMHFKSYLEEGTTKAKKGIRSWIFSTDHKRIGLMYLCSIGVFFSVAVILGILMRLELLSIKAISPEVLLVEHMFWTG